MGDLKIQNYSLLLTYNLLKLVYSNKKLSKIYIVIKVMSLINLYKSDASIITYYFIKLWKKIVLLTLLLSF